MDTYDPADNAAKCYDVAIEPKYFDIACKRIRDAYAQPDFFVEPPKPRPEQLALSMAGEGE
jgi:site-specific DNA-methyltransferase (adenine-specific)